MNKSFNESLAVTKQAVSVVNKQHELSALTSKQLETEIHPIISNAFYKRENELLEEERFLTLVSLSRSMNDEEMKRIYSALNYQITKKK